MELIVIPVEKPQDTNFILGQTHFIKSVEDIHEAIVNANPSIKFGIAFCEASQKCLIRYSGNDSKLIELAQKNALNLSCGHSFIVFLEQGFPVNILNSLKVVNEVVNIFCATANDTQVIIAESEQGRGILGVIDGEKPKGIEKEADIKERHKFLRQIGYKL